MFKGKFLLGILAGAAAGAILGVLFAPNKGVDTRKKIKQRGDDLVNGVKDGVNSTVDNINQKIDRFKDKAKYKMDGIANMIDENPSV